MRQHNVMHHGFMVSNSKSAESRVTFDFDQNYFYSYTGNATASSIVLGAVMKLIVQKLHAVTINSNVQMANALISLGVVMEKLTVSPISRMKKIVIQMPLYVSQIIFNVLMAKIAFQQHGNGKHQLIYYFFGGKNTTKN